MRTRAERRALYVFARAPAAGRVKTRLIPRLGAAGAAALLAAFVDDVCALSSTVAERRVLSVAGSIEDAHLQFVAAREGMQVLPQSDGDLGDRMAHAIRDGLQDAARVCVIGSDSPTLRPEQIARAFSLLDESDVVLGPSSDGGYWIVGATRPCDHLFDHVPWGTRAVLATSLERADEAGLTLAFADSHFDVDEPDDLEHLADELAREPDRRVAPATRAALSRLMLRSTP